MVVDSRSTWPRFKGAPAVEAPRCPTHGIMDHVSMEAEIASHGAELLPPMVIRTPTGPHVRQLTASSRAFGVTREKESRDVGAGSHVFDLPSCVLVRCFASRACGLADAGLLHAFPRSWMFLLLGVPDQAQRKSTGGTSDGLPS